MKLQTLEQFESKDSCKCGGNCGCGGKPVNEKFSFSKKEVEMAANLIASAISKADKVKAEVHDLEYDKGRGAGFEISIDGEKYEGGSYVVKDNGDVVNAAIGNLHPNAVYNTIGNKSIDDVFVNMEKYESLTTESKEMSKKEVRDLKVKINNARTIGKYFTKDEVEFLQSLFESEVNEAKKYKFKDIAKAWEFVYGEDMEDEYQGFYQEVTGKYKNKVTKSDIAKIWQEVYGEDIEADYDGFYNELKENLNEANKLDHFNEANINEGKLNMDKMIKAAGKELKKGSDNDDLDMFIEDYLEKNKISPEEFDYEQRDELYQGLDIEYGIVIEANADGTISDDEDERREELLKRVKEQMQELLASAELDAKDIGGSFRSPGIMADIKKELNNQLKKFR
jgi:hypothetical protein